MVTPPATEPGLRDGAIEVVARLRTAGFQALWAGGCVRDQALGLVPKDYDIATDATPDAVIALFERSVAVGARFGVVRVLLGPHEYEVATFRAEGDYTDGRRPSSVRWAHAEADVQRRDFTINGLLYDPGEDAVLDYVGGQADLARGIVRAIGEPAQRFAEDRLRMLRAIRFSARFGFDIDPDTWRAVLDSADTVVSVSAERIGTELTRILSEGGARRGLGLLAQASLIELLLPEVVDPEAARQRFSHVAVVDPTVAWGILLHDVGSPVDASESLGRRLRFSRAGIRALGAALSSSKGLAGYERLGLAARKRLLRAPGFEAGLAIANSAADAGQRPREPLTAAALQRRNLDEAALWPKPLITGTDLRQAGFEPGPWFKRALDAVEDAQLESRVADRTEAMALAGSELELARQDADDLVDVGG